jgi:hypothetical protein
VQTTIFLDTDTASGIPYFAVKIQKTICIGLWPTRIMGLPFFASFAALRDIQIYPSMLADGQITPQSYPFRRDLGRCVRHVVFRFCVACAAACRVE